MKPSLESPISPAGTLDGSPALSINISGWAKLYVDGNYDQLTREFLDGLRFFYENTFFGLSERDSLSITRFLECFLFYFVRPQYQIKTDDIARFISFGCVTSNLFELSHFKSADPWIKLLSLQQNSFEKILCLYSPRSELKLDTQKWFEEAPALTSLWWAYYFNHASSFSSKRVYENCMDHLDHLHKNFVMFGVGAGEPYFPVTYLNPEKDRYFKEIFNQVAAKSLEHLHTDSDAKPGKVAVISGAWIPGHAVYKCFLPLVKHLSEHFELTLVHLGETKPVDTSMFQEVIQIEMKDRSLELGAVLQARFQAVFYTDVGMDLEGKYLSNIRIAPIQMVGYGHPVSTFGSSIDYFFAGKDVEEEQPSRHYSERLVLVPGLGIHPQLPNPGKSTPNPGTPSEKILINCPWGNLKLNYPMLELLREILLKSGERVKFQFLPGGSGLNMANNYQVFQNDVHETLGEENCEILIGQNYEKYLGSISRGTLGLDSYPFCGFQSVLDNLLMGIPVITLRGQRAHSRISSALMEILGLEELIAESRDQYLERTLQLITDKKYRKKIQKKIRNLPIGKKFLEKQDPSVLTRAIQYLIDNHDRLKSENSMEPILID